MMSNINFGKIAILFILFLFCVTHLGETRLHLFFLELGLLYYLTNLFFEENLNDEFSAFPLYIQQSYKKTNYNWKSYNDNEKETYNKLTEKLKIRKKHSIEKK